VGILEATPMRVHHRERAQGSHDKLIAFLDWWETGGPFEIVVAQMGGPRSQRVVSELYAQGRTQPGPPCRCKLKPCAKHPLGLTVTNAKRAEDTAHGRAAALDLLPLINGVVPWDDWHAFERLGELAEAFGLEWGGRFPEPKDGPHVQLTGWRSLPFPPVGLVG
jgi:hypothetical protein